MSVLIKFVEIFLPILDILYKNKQEFVTLYEHTDLYRNGVLVVPSHHVHQHLVKTDQVKEYIDEYNRKNHDIIAIDPQDLLFLESMHNSSSYIFSSRKFLSEYPNMVQNISY